MKTCPYCGKEYENDAEVCSLDGWSLSDDNLSQPSVAEPVIKPELKPREAYLTFPNYRWSAKDAWKCIGMLIVFSVVSYATYRIPPLLFPKFWRSGSGWLSSSFFHYSISLLVAAYFARTETFASFCKGFGLDKKPTGYVWIGIAAALLTRMFGHFMHVLRWDKGGFPSYDVLLFKHSAGFQRYFFLVPLVILAPLFEEAVYRGFLFKAFRGSYSFLASTILIIAWTTHTHWQQYSHSWTAAFDISLLTAVQCYLREKSGSLWDSILCHSTFNFSLLFVSGILR